MAKDKRNSVNVIIVCVCVCLWCVLWLFVHIGEWILLCYCELLTFYIKIPNGPLLFRLHSIYNRINTRSQ